MLTKMNHFLGTKKDSFSQYPLQLGWESMSMECSGKRYKQLLKVNSKLSCILAIFTGGGDGKKLRKDTQGVFYVMFLDLGADFHSVLSCKNS